MVKKRCMSEDISIMNKSQRTKMRGYQTSSLVFLELRTAEQIPGQVTAAGRKPLRKEATDLRDLLFVELIPDPRKTKLMPLSESEEESEIVTSTMMKNILNLTDPKKNLKEPKSPISYP